MAKGKQHRWGAYDGFNTGISRAACTRCGLIRCLKQREEELSYEFNGASTDWGPLVHHGVKRKRRPVIVPHCPPRVEDFTHFERAPWQTDS